MSYDYQRQPAYPPQQPPQYAPQPAYAPPPRRAVTKQRKRTSHGLHLVLTICTAGLWGLCVWLPLTMWHKFGPKQKVVTRYQ